MRGPINLKSPNSTSKWQMGFNSAFKGLTKKHKRQHVVLKILYSVQGNPPLVLIKLTSFHTQDLLLSHIEPSSPGGPHLSGVPTHNILQLIPLTPSFSIPNSQHPSVVPTHNILQ